jgi:hypothetical protein
VLRVPGPMLGRLLNAKLERVLARLHVALALSVDLREVRKRWVPLQHRVATAQSVWSERRCVSGV